MSKVESVSVLTLTSQKTDYIDNTRPMCFHFEEYYLHQGLGIMKENYKFAYYFNNTNIKLVVLDGKNKLILVNWPNDRHIECNINNDIPVMIPSFPYVLLNRSVFMQL